MGESGVPPLKAGWVLLEGWGQLGHYRAGDAPLLFVFQVALVQVVRQCREYAELTAVAYAETVEDAASSTYYVAMTLGETCEAMGLVNMPAQAVP